MLRIYVFSFAFSAAVVSATAQTNSPQTTGTSLQQRADSGVAPAAGVTGTRVINFAGGVVDHTVTLNWETVTESGIREYVVEHAAPGRAFEPVGTVSAKGSGKYSFRYKSAPGSGQARLRIVKINGDPRLSIPLTLKVDGTSATLEATPNPASGLVQIQGLAYGDQAVLLGANGTALRSFTAAKTTEPLSLEGLPAGVYLLQVRSAAGDARPGLRIVKR